VSVNVPEVELILSAPVVWVNPFEAVKSPADVIVPEPVVEMLPVVEMVMLLAKSPPAIVPSKISVVVTPPVLILTAPDVTEKFEEENDAIPLAAVVASSMVIVVPDPVLLAIVSAPVKLSREATLPEAQEPKVGVVPPSKHCDEVPAVTCCVSPDPFVYKMPPFEVKAESVRLVPTVAPPVKLVAVEVVAPLPVTVSSVSASEVSPVDVEEIVITPAELVIEVVPEPFKVIGPDASLTLGTIAAAFRLTTGFCPGVTAIPVPALTE